MNLAPTPRFGSQFRIDIDSSVRPYDAKALLSNVASALQPGLGISGDDSLWIKGDRPMIAGNFDGSKIMSMAYGDHVDVFCLDSANKGVTSKLKQLLAGANPYGGGLNNGSPIATLKSVMTFKKLPDTSFTDPAVLKRAFYGHALQATYDKFKAKLDAGLEAAKTAMQGRADYYNAVVSLEGQMSDYFAVLAHQARQPN